MKKNLLSTVVLTGIFLFVFSNISAQTAGGLRTFERMSGGGHKEGAVDVYQLNAVNGHFYNFTVGMDPADPCGPRAGNDLKLFFIFPQRRQYIAVDGRQNDGAEALTFGAAADEPLIAAVAIDFSRCHQYRIQLTTSDPAVSNLPERAQIPGQQFAGSVNSLAQVQPPALNSTGTLFESRFEEDGQLLEQRREAVKNAERNTPYRKGFEWGFIGSGGFWDQVYAADFQMRRSDYARAGLFSRVDAEIGNIGQAINEEYGALSVYFSFIELPRTIQTYKQSIDRWRPQNSAELQSSLDALLTFYNDAAPPAIAEIDAWLAQKKCNGRLADCSPIILNGKIGPAFNRIYNSLNAVKKKGAAAGVQWECKFMTRKFYGELPLCDFRPRL